MFVGAGQFRPALTISIMNKKLTPAQMRKFVAIVNEVEPLPNEIDKLRPDDKNVIMDVLCHAADGTEFIVEMQRKCTGTRSASRAPGSATVTCCPLKPKRGGIRQRRS